MINAWAFLNYWGARARTVPPKSTPMAVPVHPFVTRRLDHYCSSPCGPLALFFHLHRVLCSAVSLQGMSLNMLLSQPTCRVPCIGFLFSSESVAEYLYWSSVASLALLRPTFGNFAALSCLWWAPGHFVRPLV